MVQTRRTLVFGLAALGLAACGGAPRRAGSAAPAPRTEEVLPIVPNPGWDAWVAAFRPRAAAAGISEATLSSAFAGAGFIPGVVERDRNQAEFARTLEDYLSIAASEQRIADGRANFARYATTLSAIEARYGVEGHVVTAFWGVESNYGGRRGNVPVISALSTLAYDGRRGAFFEEQLIAALRILQDGDIPAARMTGSWAGAMGHTQFIPTSYRAYAVDFTGDGRRDIWGEDPTDALASTANYLARAGWRRGEPWGEEVTGEGGGGEVIQPQPGGPRFRVYHNYRVIRRYNNAVSYAIGVGHLSDRIRGAGPLRGAFPPDANGLTRADRQALQEGLTRAGYDTGGADGVIGNNTRAAISAFQQARGLPVTGEPSRALLALLR